MLQECELLATCSFFKKYQKTKDLACKGFIIQYCKGAKMDQCKRKEYRKQNGHAPTDDLMPSGQMIRA